MDVTLAFLAGQTNLRAHHKVFIYVLQVALCAHAGARVHIGQGGLRVTPAAGGRAGPGRCAHQKGLPRVPGARKK